MELRLLNLLILIDCFLCNSYPCVLFDSTESLPHVINQESHVYLWNLGKIYLIPFFKFWKLPRFWEISKFQKSELSKFILNFPLKHVITSTNLLYIFRTPFPKNTSRWLLLLYSHTAKSILILCESKLNLIHNGWLFAKNVLFVFCLLHFKPSLHYFHWCHFLLLTISNCNAVVSWGTCVSNRFC